VRLTADIQNVRNWHKVPVAIQDHQSPDTLDWFCPGLMDRFV
jgi:hypothetical protein